MWCWLWEMTRPTLASSAPASSKDRAWDPRPWRSAVALGASYDPGQWFVMAEFVDFKGDGFLADSRSWYVSSGYRFASFTPYATLSRTRADVVPEAGISTAGASALAAGAAGLNAGINASLNSFSGSQDGVSVGVRWDFMKNVALKTQYDRINVADDSNGRMANVQPAFKQGGHVDLFSVALDFAF